MSETDATAVLDMALEVFQATRNVSDETLIHQLTAFIANHGLAPELMPWLESCVSERIEDDVVDDEIDELRGALRACRALPLAHDRNCRYSPSFPHCNCDCCVQRLHDIVDRVLGPLGAES